MLRKQQRITQLLLDRLDPTLAPNEMRSIAGRAAHRAHRRMADRGSSREKLTVADEREHVLFYLVEILYRVVPAFYDEIGQALEKLYDVPAESLELPTIIRFGSWVGGDMDGNPDVNAKSLRETLARQQQLIVNAYFAECQTLVQQLSQSASRISVSAALSARIDEYITLLPGARVNVSARHDRMPYRVFLAQVGERLRHTFAGRANGYEEPRQFRADIH